MTSASWGTAWVTGIAVSFIILAALAILILSRRPDPKAKFLANLIETVAAENPELRDSGDSEAPGGAKDDSGPLGTSGFTKPG